MSSKTNLLLLVVPMALTLVATPACLNRKEAIKVAPDGTIHLQVEFEGDPEDINSGDAMLADPGPWSVNDEIETDDDGDQTLTRTATLTVPPGQDIPTNFAGDDDDLAELALNFETSLRIEERPEGTYYHFKRVYHRRDWSHIHYFRRKFMEEELKKLEDTDFSELSEQDRGHVADALISFEAIKVLMLGQEAAEALEGTLPQEDWLAVHLGICEVFEELDRQLVADLLQLEGEEAEAEIAAAVEEVNEKLEARMEAALNRRDPSGRTHQIFKDQFERERRRYAITEDLQDETIEVVVELPGVLVGHNSLERDIEGGPVLWRFEGDSLNDRDVVLLATSVLENPE